MGLLQRFRRLSKKKNFWAGNLSENCLYEYFDLICNVGWPYRPWYRPPYIEENIIFLSYPSNRDPMCILTFELLRVDSNSQILWHADARYRVPAFFPTKEEKHTTLKNENTSQAKAFPPV